MIEFLGKILVLARPYKARLVLGMLFSVLFALSNALLMLVVKFVPDLVFAADGQDILAKHLAQAPEFVRDLLGKWAPQVTAPSSSAGLVLVISTIPLVMLFRGLFAYLNVYCMNWAAVRAVADLRLRLFEHLQGLSLDFFHRERTGALISRMLSDTAALHQAIASSLATVVRDPITVLSLLALLLWQQPTLTLISLLVFPGCIVPVVIYARKVRKSAKALQSHIADLADTLHEGFTGNRIVKAYNLERSVVKRFTFNLSRFVNQYMRILRAQEIPGPIVEFLGSVGVALVFAYIVWLSPGRISPGDLIQFVGSVFMMYQPIKALTRLQNQLEQARAASSRVFELLAVRSTITEPASPVPLRAAGAAIEFDRIDFDYGEKPVLSGVSLRVEPGQMLALVGKSGSGKTTLTNLLLRFYDPVKGAVRIGGTDIRQVETRDLRSQIALVAQETILFNDTVRNNIALGRPGATDAEIVAAAKYAHAHEFIVNKPQGYDTVIGEKGVALSAGQRQRISIARAILRNAPILVLDEATSALDTESERAVQAALEDLMRDRTTICIAHRLSTVQKADLIAVLDHGQVAELGTHVELLRKRGIYYKFHQLGFEETAEDREPSETPA